MTAPFFVEILSRNEDVKYRHRVHSLPISIGRGYDNDIILDDPTVSAHHALIDQTAEGGLIIRDLGSHNGIMYKGSCKTEMEIDGNMIFRLGQTMLRVRSAAFPVAPEKENTTSYNWEGWRPALTGLVIIIVLTALTTWVSDTAKFEALRYIGMIALTLFIGLLWCGIWAFVTRLYGGNARFGRHLFIFACGITAMEIWELLSGITAYAFSLEMITHYSSHGTIVLAAVMVFFHLLTVNPNLGRSFALICIMLAVVGSGSILMTNYYRNGYLADELFMYQRFPPMVRQSRDKPVDHLINDAKKLKTRIDGERTKAVSGNEEEMFDNDE